MHQLDIIDAIHELRFAVSLLFGFVGLISICANKKKRPSVDSQGSRKRTPTESKVKLPKQSQGRQTSQMQNIPPAVQPKLMVAKVETQKTEPQVPTVRKSPSKNEKNPTQKNEVDERKSVTCLDSDEKLKVGANGATAKNITSKPKNTIAGNEAKNAKGGAAELEPKAESPHVVKEELVQKMGNLDNEIKERRAQFEREINELPSRHELSVNPPPQPDAKAHVRINEARCKLYETNQDEAANDEENADAI
ncbi:hypothetical protein M3Y94_00485000 [Aphelenchoides besseyi]|nr:hypothetical protein M3Y94_00485000 [Aphelenchoides besseyi]KAI6217412.1 hypothetical protein M3Y95_01216400 [Aphelenchoides besseyi]